MPVPDFVEEAPAAAIVISTDDGQYSDNWHHHTAGCIDPGQRFAQAMAGLEKREKLRLFQ